MEYIVTWQALMTTAAAYGKEQDPVKKEKLKDELIYLENLAKVGSISFFPYEDPFGMVYDPSNS